jgi:hypothetical protein
MITENLKKSTVISNKRPVCRQAERPQQELERLNSDSAFHYRDFS